MVKCDYQISAHRHCYRSATKGALCIVHFKLKEKRYLKRMTLRSIETKVEAFNQIVFALARGGEATLPKIQEVVAQAQKRLSLQEDDEPPHGVPQVLSRR